MMKKKNQGRRDRFNDELAGLKVEMMDQINCEHKWNHKKGDSNIKMCVLHILSRSRKKSNM